MKMRDPAFPDGPPKRWGERLAGGKTPGELHDGLVLISWPGNNEHWHSHI